MASPWTGRRVLITGGGGFIGSALTLRLTELGAQVSSPRSRDHDLRRPKEVEQVFADSRPEYVFHLAARVGGLAANVRQPATFLYDTALLSLLVVNEAARRGVERLVALGSICAYPKGCPVPLREERLWDGYPEPTNGAYAIAKRLGLAQLQACRKEFGLSGIYLIPGNVYGPRDNFEPETSHVVPGLLTRLTRARQAGDPKFILWGTGRPTRDFLYVDDAVEGMLAAAERYDSEEPLNLGSGVATTIRDLAVRAARVVGYQGELDFDPSRPDGEMARLLDTARAREALGFTAPTSLEEGLARTYGWMREIGLA